MPIKTGSNWGAWWTLKGMEVGLERAVRIVSGGPTKGSSSRSTMRREIIAELERELDATREAARKIYVETLDAFVLSEQPKHPKTERMVCPGSYEAVDDSKLHFYDRDIEGHCSVCGWGHK